MINSNINLKIILNNNLVLTLEAWKLAIAWSMVRSFDFIPDQKHIPKLVIRCNSIF